MSVRDRRRKLPPVVNPPCNLSLLRGVPTANARQESKVSADVAGRVPATWQPGALNPVSPFEPADYVRNPNFPELDNRKLIPAVRREELRDRALWSALPPPRPVVKDGNVYNYERSWVWRGGTEVSDERLVRIDLNPTGPIGGSISFVGPSGDERAIGWAGTGSTMAGDAARFMEMDPSLVGWLDRKSKEWNMKSYIDLGGKRGEETIEEMSLDMATLKAIGDTFPSMPSDAGALAEIKQIADGLAPVLAMMEQTIWQMPVDKIWLDLPVWLGLGMPDPTSWTDVLHGLRLEKRGGKVFLAKDVSIINLKTATRDDAMKGAHRVHIEVDPLAGQGEEALTVREVVGVGVAAPKPFLTKIRQDGVYPLSAEGFAARKVEWMQSSAELSKTWDALQARTKTEYAGSQNYGKKTEAQAGWLATAISNFFRAALSGGLTEVMVAAVGGSKLTVGNGPPIRLSAVVAASMLRTPGEWTYYALVTDLLYIGLVAGKLFVQIGRIGRERDA